MGGSLWSVVGINAWRRGRGQAVSSSPRGRANRRLEARASTGFALRWRGTLQAADDRFHARHATDRAIALATRESPAQRPADDRSAMNAIVAIESADATARLLSPSR